MSLRVWSQFAAFIIVFPIWAADLMQPHEYFAKREFKSIEQFLEHFGPSAATTMGVTRESAPDEIKNYVSENLTALKDSAGKFWSSKRAPTPDQQRRFFELHQHWYALGLFLEFQNRDLQERIENFHKENLDQAFRKTEYPDDWLAIARFQTVPFFGVASEKSRAMWENRTKFFDTNPEKEQILEYLLLLDGDLLDIAQPAGLPLSAQAEVRAKLLTQLIQEQHTNTGALLVILESTLQNMHFGLEDWESARQNSAHESLARIYWFKHHWAGLIRDMMLRESGVQATDLSRYEKIFGRLPSRLKYSKGSEGDVASLSVKVSRPGKCINGLQALASRLKNNILGRFRLGKSRKS